MGKRENTLRRILEYIGISIEVGTLRYPKVNDVSQSYLYDEVKRVYRELGGCLKEIPLNLRKWDLELNGYAVELDEYLHFNRYRKLTLDSSVYDLLDRFPHEEYLKMCADHEEDCLRAGSYGGKWTNRGCEKQFGRGGSEGDLAGSGSPRWKQRAFYDFVKDLSPVIIGMPIARISIWDKVLLDGRLVLIGTLLDQQLILDKQLINAGNVLMPLIESRIVPVSAFLNIVYPELLKKLAQNELYYTKSKNRPNYVIVEGSRVLVKTERSAPEYEEIPIDLFERTWDLLTEKGKISQNELSKVYNIKRSAFMLIAFDLLDDVEYNSGSNSLRLVIS